MAKTAERGKFKYREIFNEVRSSNSRAAVLLAGAFIEQLLLGAIKLNLIAMSKADTKSLFEFQGPLGTFSAKIAMGFALDLYGKKLRLDLDAIRKIRNDFAHSVDKFDADHPSVKGKIEGLHALAAIEDKGSLTTHELLARAAEIISMFLIMRTAPTTHKISDSVLQVLKVLDFAQPQKLKLRDEIPFDET